MGEKKNRVEREKEDVRRGCIDRMRDDSRERKAEKVKGITSISKRQKKKRKGKRRKKSGGRKHRQKQEREENRERRKETKH